MKMNTAEPGYVTVVK